MFNDYPSSQRTLGTSFTVEGVGLHGGEINGIHVHSAPEGHGIVFQRMDLPNQPLIPAHYSYVSNTFLCTKLSNAQGDEAATTEHLMAALASENICNALIQMQGLEIPFLDGSALPFIEKIKKAGTTDQKVPCLFLKMTETVRVENKDQWVQLEPAEHFSANVTYDFKGRQGLEKYTCHFKSQDDFVKNIAPARSFGFYEDAEKLYAQKLSLGASLDNTVVIDQGKVMNPSGLRFKDEYVRHKILDAIGDLALAGAPILGKYSAYNGGHGLHFKLLEKVFAQYSFGWIS